MINGVFCHETGCPIAWIDVIRQCKWCGTSFKPTYKHQYFCDESCDNDYNGIKYDIGN